MKVCSFNIRYENDQDGMNHWKKRIPLIREFFTDNDFHILGTQEGRKGQIDLLCENIELLPITTHREWIENRMYPTLYFNPKYFTVMESGDCWLSNTPDIAGSSSFKSAFPRLLTWAILKTQNFEIFVANFHLDHVLEETRIEQIKVGINCLIKQNPTNLPMVILGDFNDNPNSKTRELLVNAHRLIDPWLEKNKAEETSHHGFLGDKALGNRIDWILHSKSLKTSKIELIKKESNGTYLSDHYPLVATFIPN